MTHMYRILAIAGWAWLVLVAVFMAIRLTLMRRKTRGFDVAAASPGSSERSAESAEARK